MAFMYIRSQDKERLINFDAIYSVDYLETQDYSKGKKQAEPTHTIAIDIKGLCEEIGTYESKERCIVIIDEIQKKCISYMMQQGGMAILKGQQDY